LSEEVKEVLQEVVRNVLEDPFLEGLRESYGGKEKTLALVDGEKVGWPKGFEPLTRGYSLVKAKPDPFDFERQVLGIRLEKFELRENKNSQQDPAIEVRLFNAVGHDTSAQRCGFYLKRDGKRWKVEYP
jgi:hypothetical protein